jgi:hypothetical protein
MISKEKNAAELAESLKVSQVETGKPTKPMTVWLEGKPVTTQVGYDGCMFSVGSLFFKPEEIETMRIEPAQVQ